tara:strand:+ start:222 stop:848 length:627 start_codon:yes stop_codon:yes gene_type:complete
MAETPTPQPTDDERWMDDIPPMPSALVGQIGLTGGAVKRDYGTAVQTSMGSVPKTGGHDYSKQAGDRFEIPGHGMYGVSAVSRSGRRIVLIDEQTGKEFMVGKEDKVKPIAPVVQTPREIAAAQPRSSDYLPSRSERDHEYLREFYEAPEGTSLASLQFTDALNESIKDVSLERPDGIIEHRLVMPGGSVKTFLQNHATGKISNVTGL